MIVVLGSSEPLEPVTKRATYAEGIGAKSFKNSSVKKLMIIGCMGDTAESYPTIKKMMGEVGVTGVDGGHCMDIKITLIIIGRQKGKPKHGCTVGDGSSPWTGKHKCKLQTLGDAREWNEKFDADGRPWARAQDYSNFVNWPLLVGEDEVLLLELLHLPGCHILTGNVQKQVETLENTFKDKNVGHNFVDKYLKQVHATRAHYHGKYSFEGNQARKVLKHISSMRLMVPTLPRRQRSKVIQVIEVMEAVDKVVEACFGMPLKDNYVSLIQDYSAKYRAIPGITFPTKFHMVEQHIQESIEMKHPGRGIGAFTEQAFESAHHAFGVEWANTKVDIEHHDFNNRMMDTVSR
mgnify:CR=1 FL=1